MDEEWRTTMNEITHSIAVNLHVDKCISCNCYLESFCLRDAPTICRILLRLWSLNLANHINQSVFGDTNDCSIAFQSLSVWLFRNSKKKCLWGNIDQRYGKLKTNLIQQITEWKVMVRCIQQQQSPSLLAMCKITIYCNTKDNRLWLLHLLKMFNLRKMIISEVSHLKSSNECFMAG